MIYFDANATSLPNMKAFDMASKMCYPYAYNASSTHKLGRTAKAIIENSRQNILENLGYDSNDFNLVFCSSATEANNLILSNVDNYTLIISSIEHLSIINKANHYHNVKKVSVDKNGIINLEELESYLSSCSNSFISIMGANNETGILQPLSEIKFLAKKYEAIFHSDMVQMIGKVPLNILPDICTISAHKFGGPQGIGALIYHKKIKLSPMIFGGGQERGTRSGTENIFAISFMNFALKYIDNLFNIDKCEKIRNYLEERILNIANDNITIIGKNSPRLPNTSCIITPHISNNLQLTTFDLNNIAISAGSACSSGKITTSYVLRAMGYSEELAQCAIRVSLSNHNSYEEVDQFVQVWQNLFLKSQQRKIS